MIIPKKIKKVLSLSMAIAMCFSVSSRADNNLYESHNISVFKNENVDLKTAFKNIADILKNNKMLINKSVSTSEVGEKEAEVLFFDKDNNTHTEKVRVNVLDTITDINKITENNIKKLTVKKGEKVDFKKAIIGVEGNFTVDSKEEINTDLLGEKYISCVISLGETKKDIKIPISIIDETKEVKTKILLVQKNTLYDIRKAFIDLSDDVIVKEDKKPIDTSQEGERTIDVTMFYKDGTIMRKKVVINVVTDIKPTTKAEFKTFKPSSINVTQGVQNDISKKIPNMPKDVSVKMLNDYPDKKGVHQVELEFEHEGEKKVEKVTVNVNKSMASEYTPNIKPISIVSGEQLNVLKAITNMPDNVKITYDKSVDTTSVGIKKIGITVHFKDGSSKKIKIPIVIE